MKMVAILKYILLGVTDGILELSYIHIFCFETRFYHFMVFDLDMD